MKAYQHRDLSIIEFSDHLLITACDSSGGVGEKPGDALQVPGKYVSIFATRVCLFELLSCGGKIIGLSNTISCEMHPTGETLIQGIHVELNRAGIKGIKINGSTEENFPSTMTGFGVFIMAMAPKLHVTPSKPGDLVVCIGKPKFGANLQLENDNEIACYDDIHYLIQCANLREIVPCGSKGILYEAQNLGALYNLSFTLKPNPLSLTSSAGPATTLIASIDPKLMGELQLHFGKRLTLIGVFK